MRFLFVDSIAELSDLAVRGHCTFGLDEPWNRDTVTSPGVISEAIGQLASWLCLAKNDFTARPVFLFAESIELLASVPAGRTVELVADVSQIDAEAFTFSGEALVDGRVVQRIVRCSGYFMPLGELEDPAETRRRFAALREGGLRLAGKEGPTFDFDGLVGEVVEAVPGERISAMRSFGTAEPFYADHFPRFPVTPIVMLNEMIAATAKRGFGACSLSAVRDIKIKSFVRPGDVCETRVVLQSREGRRLRTVAEIVKDGKRILRGVYDFDLGKELSR